MTRNRFIVILVCLFIALPFYVSVWTWNDTELGGRWLYTGFVMVFQGVMTGFIYSLCNDNNGER